MESFNSAVCHLCGNSAGTRVSDIHFASSMMSDGLPSQREWKKVECVECGLIREGNNFESSELLEHYEKNYKVNSRGGNEEHIFFRGEERIERSSAFAEWMFESLTQCGITEIKTAFEIGAGKGNLINKLSEFYPNTSFGGCEVSEEAVKLAAKNGVILQHGNDSQLTGKYDLIYAICVFEHVPDPVKFMQNIGEHLTENGVLLLSQPMQDLESWDIFYVDHLHHFHTKHVELLGNKAGMKQIGMAAEPWFARETSLHIFTKSELNQQHAYSFIANDAVKTTITKWTKIFSELSVNERLKNARCAVYGLNEVANLLYSYGGLQKLNLVLGIDDYPEKHKDNIYGLDVFPLNDLTEEQCKNIDIVILAMNKVYYPKVQKACMDKGLQTLSIYSE